MMESSRTTRMIFVLFLSLVLAAEARPPGGDPAHVHQLLQQGKDLLEQGWHPAAAKRFDEALKLLREYDPSIEKAIALNGLAFTLPPDVERLARHLFALDLARRFKDRRVEAEALFGIGVHFHLAHVNRGAVEPLEESLGISTELGEHEDAAKVHNTLGEVRWLLGSYEDALNHFDKAATLSRTEDESLEAAKLRYRLGQVNYLLGRYEDAMVHFEAALPMFTRIRDSVNWDTVGRPLGDMFQQLEELTERAAAMTAEEKREDMANGGEAFKEMLSEFMVALSGHDLDAQELRENLASEANEGFETYEDEELEKYKAVAAAREQYATNGSFPGDFLQLCKYISVADHRATQQNEFIETCRRAKEWAKRERDPALEALVSEIAIDLRVEHSAPTDFMVKAYSSVDESWHPSGSLEIYKAAQAKDCLNIVNDFIRRTFLALDRPEDAEALSAGLKEQWVRWSKQRGIDPENPTMESLFQLRVTPHIEASCWDTWEDDSKLRQAAQKQNSGDLVGALSDYQKPLVSRELEIRARAMRGIGSVYEKQGNLARALEFYRGAVDVLESMQGEIRQEQWTAAFAARQSSLYASVIALLVERGEASLAFEYAERARARAFLDQLGNKKLALHDAPDELAALELEYRQRLIEVENLHKTPGYQEPPQFDKVRKTYEAVIEQLRRSHPEYASLVSVQTTTLDELKPLVDDRTTLVEYFVLAEKTLAWVIDREGYRFSELDISSKDLSQHVSRLRESLGPGRTFDRAISAKLHQALITPLQPYVRHPNLVIVGHGPLHYLPFASLWDPDRERYLVQAHGLTLLPSASSLRFLREKRNVNRGRMLVLGNPDGSLSFAEGEAMAIASLYGTSPLLKSEAKESRVHADSGQVDFLHVASHAVYENRPLFTYLALASDEHFAGSHTDGKLEVHEVYGLDLGEANLVVLSACNTALGSQSSGDDVTGLARAFLAAGAPSVMATLWKVDDAAAAVLMETFYRHLRQGKAYAKALRAAQVELIGDERWSSPYYWGAFTLIGDYLGYVPSSSYGTSGLLSTRF